MDASFAKGFVLQVGQRHILSALRPCSKPQSHGYLWWSYTWFSGCPASWGRCRVRSSSNLNHCRCDRRQDRKTLLLKEVSIAAASMLGKQTILHSFRWKNQEPFITREVWLIVRSPPAQSFVIGSVTEIV